MRDFAPFSDFWKLTTVAEGFSLSFATSVVSDGTPSHEMQLADLDLLSINSNWYELNKRYDNCREGKNLSKNSRRSRLLESNVKQ